MTTDSTSSRTIHALDEATRVDRLVVASDFDGTLSPFVDDPSSSRLAPGALDALRALASLPRTTVALLSGRDRATLSECSGIPLAASESGIELVGAHGAEWEDSPAGPDEAESALLAEVTAALEEIAAPHDGAFVERKPTSSALHVRRIPDAATGEALLDAALRGPGSLPGAHVTSGKAVLEIAVRDASKGAALSALRERVGADAVVFFGDDVTDEKGFAVLGAGAGGADLDVSVKVGEGETAADYRLDGIDEVVAALSRIAARRR
ncbi:trehalose-phosphatase [Dietzia sp.]|uniref:trehalose-phosphatase n=1 Tax=Dietzia sp. TaxID=1871616 RepID=UPI002FD9A945